MKARNYFLSLVGAIGQDNMTKLRMAKPLEQMVCILIKPAPKEAYLFNILSVLQELARYLESSPHWPLGRESRHMLSERSRTGEILCQEPTLVLSGEL